MCIGLKSRAPMMADSPTGPAPTTRRQHPLVSVDHLNGGRQPVGIDANEHLRHELRPSFVAGWLTPGGHCY